MTLFEESKQSSLEIERTLDVLQKFLIQKIKELESKIIELMKWERIKVLIKSKKYVDLYDAQPSYMLIYRKSLREIKNNIGTKNIYYMLYNNKDTGKLSYKIHGYSHKDTIEPKQLDTLDDLSDTLTTLYEFYNLIKPAQQTETQQPVKSTSMFGRIFRSNKVAQSPSSGGKSHHTPAYKSTGDKIHLLIDNKRVHRSIYVKGNGNGKAKYCKINNEFVLLSKLKNKVIE